MTWGGEGIGPVSGGDVVAVEGGECGPSGLLALVAHQFRRAKCSHTSPSPGAYIQHEMHEQYGDGQGAGAALLEGCTGACRRECTYPASTMFSSTTPGKIVRNRAKAARVCNSPASRLPAIGCEPLPRGGVCGWVLVGGRGALVSKCQANSEEKMVQDVALYGLGSADPDVPISMWFRADACAT